MAKSTKMLMSDPDISLSPYEYAIQGNAILGIRDSGKSYTAMKAAETLLEHGIPIVVFDPVGIWRHLKTGVKGFKGFPVVVAGGNHGDIKLTVDSAPDIMRAAMKSNISIVFDLYSVELSKKSIWIKVVQSCVDILMYENFKHGVRHIFLEEAAEFIPQKIQPQHNMIYSSFERLARMGRNAKLGYTLINQRAEEINKAIFEISAFCFMHKQTGKNSLLSIQKWFNVKQTEDYGKIMKSLPTLKQGECWVVGEGEPVLVKIKDKKTFHPSPSKEEEPTKHSKPIDVSKFIDQINEGLKAKDEPVIHKAADFFRPPIAGNNDERIKALEKIISEHEQFRKSHEQFRKDVEKVVDAMAESFNTWSVQSRAIASSLADLNSLVHGKFEPGPQRKVTGHSITKGKLNDYEKGAVETNNSLGKCETEIMRFILSRRSKSFTKEQIALFIGYRPTSGGFKNSISKLVQMNMVKREGGRIGAVDKYDHEFIKSIGTSDNQSLDLWLDKLGKCEKAIFEKLRKEPHRNWSKAEIAEVTGYQETSGGFKNAISKLKTMALLKKDGAFMHFNPELLEV